MHGVGGVEWVGALAPAEAARHKQVSLKARSGKILFENLLLKKKKQKNKMVLSP